MGITILSILLASKNQVKKKTRSWWQFFNIHLNLSQDVRFSFVTVFIVDIILSENGKLILSL
jgi:hypothetical protein